MAMDAVEIDIINALIAALIGGARDQVLTETTRRMETAEAALESMAEGSAGDPDQPVMIFSGEHGAFWRARGEGYTIRSDMAGQWPRSRALGEIAGAGPEKMLTLVPLAETLAPVPAR